MVRFARVLGPVLALLVFLTPVASAQGMVQLSLRDVPELAPAKGAKPSAQKPILLELEAGALIKGESRQVILALQLAPGTSAADLCELISKRYERAGFDVLAPSPDRRGEATSGTLFLMDTLFVHIRLLGPIASTLTTCEGAPQSLRIQPPAASAAAGTLNITGTLKHPQRDQIEVLRMEVPLAVGDHPAQISERLHGIAMKNKLLSERPRGDAWQPVRSTDGGLLQGLSAEIDGAGDWRLELVLPTKRQ